MATYPEIASWVRSQHGFTPQTCWIADVKAAHGLTRGPAPNRADTSSRVKPCPPARQAAIAEALAHFGMI